MKPSRMNCFIDSLTEYRRAIVSTGLNGYPALSFALAESVVDSNSGAYSAQYVSL